MVTFTGKPVEKNTNVTLVLEQALLKLLVVTTTSNLRNTLSYEG